MQQYFFLSYLMLNSFLAFTQKTTFTCRVVDEVTSKGISEVKIVVAGEEVARTNALGYFQYATHPNVEFEAIHVGYVAVKVRFQREHLSFQIALKPVIHRLQKIELSVEDSTDSSVNYTRDTLSRDRLAQYPGGLHSFNDFIRKKLSGLKYEFFNAYSFDVYFAVGTEGNLTFEGTTLEDSILSNSIKNIYQSSEKWYPAIQNGVSVRSGFMQTIEVSKISVSEGYIPPLFPGGMHTFYRFIYEQLQYPQKALKAGISGEVLVSYNVDKEGYIRDPKVIKGIGGGCDEEAIRVLGEMPRFFPALNDFQPTEYELVTPISFKEVLENGKARKPISDANSKEFRDSFNTLRAQQGTLRGAYGVPNSRRGYQPGSLIPFIPQVNRDFNVSIPVPYVHYLSFESAINAKPEPSAVAIVRADLEEIPPTVVALKKLTYLDLTTNKISQVPNYFGLLKRLEFLNLNDNEISALPQSMEQLSKIKGIALADNEFDAFPTVLIACKNLEFIDFKNNNLEEVPSGVFGLKNLKVLDLSNNHLSELPKSIENSNLETLYLQGNLFSENEMERIRKRLKNTKVID